MFSRERFQDIITQKSEEADELINIMEYIYDLESELYEKDSIINGLQTQLKDLQEQISKQLLVEMEK